MSFKGLTTGVSGLQAQAKKMEVIGHNLANIGTAGYKRSTVTFHELYSDQLKGASAGDGSNIGGTNPMEVGGGVGVSSIHKIFNQGARQTTARALDFMIDGDDFFVVKNGANEQLMLTRNGSFGLDGNRFIVDAFGNKVQGFTVDRETQTVSATAGAIQIDKAALAPKATSVLNWHGNIAPPARATHSGSDTLAWEVFSGGENFGSMSISSTGSGTKSDFGSGYYSDSVVYHDAAASMNAGLNIVTLNAAPASLVEGFQVGDTVSVLQGTSQVQRTVSAVNTVTREVTLLTAAGGTFAAGALEITNLSRGTAAEGTSGSTLTHNDVLRSQISMVDENGLLLASFYRVDNSPAKYDKMTATDTALSKTTIGSGEFTTMKELKELMEQALRDEDLTNYSASTGLSIDIDKFGKINLGGTGLVENFRLVMNADNTEMLDRFSGIAMTDAAAVATTQARVDSSGQTIIPPALALGARTVHASKEWYSAAGIENYGYSSAKQASEFGEFAGLRLDNGATGKGYGTLELSMVNALGETVTQEFRVMPRDADPNNNEFSTMGQLAKLIQNTLRSSNYSTIADNGTLTGDDSATSSFVDGRLVVTTANGTFRDLTVKAKNTTTDTTNGVNRTDSMNFGTVLGALSNGVNGKTGISNQFINADIKREIQVYDSQGNSHSGMSYFVKDQSSGLTNIEWKFKTSLNPNLNTFVAENLDDKDIYGETFNSLHDDEAAIGVLAFDIKTGDVLGDNAAGSDARYSSSAELRFTAQTNSAEADESIITVNFDELTSYKGRNTIDGQNLDGYPMGNYVRLSTGENTGDINAVYSNGQVINLAKIGLMAVENPGGLEKTGSSYFVQTPNSSAGGTAKGVDQIFAVGDIAGASSDSVQSRIHGGHLEASNVDLTEELTDMIVTQRSYSASGKIITTSDEMLQEALNLKR